MVTSTHIYTTGTSLLSLSLSRTERRSRRENQLTSVRLCLYLDVSLLIIFCLLRIVRFLRIKDYVVNERNVLRKYIFLVYCFLVC